jgi:hypothetical protein
MIIKGTSRAGGGALAAHLGNAETNERVSLVETRGTIADDLRGALLEMDAHAAGTRCQKSLYHAAISPEPPHRLSPEQRRVAIDTLESKLGLDGHARVVVLHEKEGRQHLHVVWSRIDLDSMKAVHDGHNFRKHEEVARHLERLFGHDRVQGAHAERDGVARPDRTPSRSELRQEERTGIKGKQVKIEVTAAYQASDSAEAFRAALDAAGYVLAQGDRRDFVVVDQMGGIHSLARRIDGVNAAGLREFMAPIDRDSLPSADDAVEIAEERARRRSAGHDLANLEASYSNAADYVTQTRAAQQHHELRQQQLDNGDARPQQPAAYDERQDRAAEEDHARRSAEASDLTRGGASIDSAAASPDSREVSEARRARIERLLSGEGGERERFDSRGEERGEGGQEQAPGGGHGRGR